MGCDTKFSLNAREQLEQFLGIFFTRFSKPRLKFLRQMLYGIQITKSVILGYWGCMAVACEPGKRRGVVPLQFRLWSTEDPEYNGEAARQGPRASRRRSAS